MRVEVAALALATVVACTTEGSSDDSTGGRGGGSSAGASAGGKSTGGASAGTSSPGGRGGGKGQSGGSGFGGTSTGAAGEAGETSGGSSATGGKGGTSSTAGSTSGSGRGGAGPQGGTGNSVVDPGVAGEAPYDWVGVIGTGQSLSVGWEAPAISETPSAYGNLVLRDDGPEPRYPIDDSGSPVWSVVPLSEPVRRSDPFEGPGEYPNNIWHIEDIAYGESPHTGMADSISEYCLAREHHCVTTHIVVGVGGVLLDEIDRGSHSYRAALHEASVYMELAAAAGKSFGVGSIIFTHGESDAYNPYYGEGVAQLWQDYNADLKEVTGQAEDVVLLASQQSSSASGYEGGYGSAIQLWQASVDNPTGIVVTGPKYQYGPYGLHMNAQGYKRMGEKYGQVHDYIVNRKIAWRPLEPTAVTRAGDELTIDFHVPVPPLVWDEELSRPNRGTAWENGRGFEVRTTNGGNVEIASAEIDGESVVLTLAGDPGGAELIVGYAVSGSSSEGGGTDEGPHGQLRDSDPFTGLTTDTVEYNYCVHFAMPVP